MELDDPFYRARHPSLTDSEEDEEPDSVDRDDRDDVYRSTGEGEGAYMVKENYESTYGNRDDFHGAYNSADDYDGVYNTRTTLVYDGVYNRRDDRDGAYPRSVQTQSSEEEEVKEPAERKVVDPGPFRYNKRIFFTALPCLLLMLVMAGETFLLISTLGTMVIILMTQMGEDTSRRCVVVFALLFIPCHILMVVTVLPLIWLSAWNLVLVGLVNMFCILTGGWIILQFPAFRMEETALCATVEQLLFTMYPCVCSALVTWVLSIVVPLLMTPFIFLALWFVCLQLYLLPAASSFKSVEEVDEDTNVLQQPTVILIVVAYMLSGPLLHVCIAAFSSASGGLFTLTSLSVLLTLISVGVFLTTLLSLRQLCEYLGWSHMVVVRARWVSGAAATLLCYPVLQELGLASHFLPWLPVAIATFAAFGLVLAHKFGKIWSLALMFGLSILLCFWLSSLPWGLTHFSFYFLAVVPINMFYVFVGSNFIMCLLTIYSAWHGPKEVFGFLVLLQSAGMTVCEIALYQAELYSFIGFQLTGVTAAYTIYRLSVAEKLARKNAIFSSAIHLTKMAAGQHLSLLLLSLAVSGQSFLLPVAFYLLQRGPSIADLVGLWYGFGGVLVLFYALQHGESAGTFDQMLRVCGVLGGVGAVVTVMQPQFQLSLFAVFQWSEVFSILLLAAILATKVDPSLTQMLISSALLGVCPGIHTALLLYAESVTVLHCVILVCIICILLAFLNILVKITEVSDATEKVIELGHFVCVVELKEGECCGRGVKHVWRQVACQIRVCQIVNIMTDSKLLELPAWRVALVVTTLIAVILKSLAVKLGEQDGLLYDLWCCVASVILTCLQRDSLLLSSLSPSNRATPTVMAALGTLVISTLLRSRFWRFDGLLLGFFGICELLSVLFSLPVYVVLFGIMWKGEIWSEKAVVFTMPLNALVFLFGSSYTAWMLSVAGFVCGIGMMMLKLPLLPYNHHELRR
ncbi:hypothetical protein BaRGS_00005465 [Batillaria attramentaria]|uniref:Uncharacterized protein n=1 Tax=Batillaria attramentaria TaxID=370345 RepID=A0ABD0LUI2_9CAEN